MYAFFICFSSVFYLSALEFLLTAASKSAKKVKKHIKGLYFLNKAEYICPNSS